MSSQNTVDNAPRPSSGPRGIVAPTPKLYTSISPGQRIEVRPFEPIYIWIERRFGAGTQIEGFNKKTPFTMTKSDPPPGVARPRAPGDFYMISVKPGVKHGQVDRLKLATRPVVPGNPPPSSTTSFTLVTGSIRYY